MNMGGVAACSSQFGLFSTGRKSQKDAQLILLHTPLRFPYRQRPAEPIRHALPRTKLSFRALGINRHLGIQKHAVARPSILVWFGPGPCKAVCFSEPRVWNQVMALAWQSLPLSVPR